MLIRIALTLILLCFPGVVQAQNGPYLNPPIYATGYIPAQAGTTRATVIVNSRNPPANLNVLATGAITTWNITLPQPAFDGQIISISCPGGNVSLVNVLATSPDTVQSGGFSTCTAASLESYQYNVYTGLWSLLTSPVSTSIANNSPLYFDTKAIFVAQPSIPAGVNYVNVRAVTGTFPPTPTTLESTPLTYYRYGTSPSGLFGEVLIGGVYWDPLYSTSPVNTGEFGDIADGVATTSGSSIQTATAPGSSNTLTLSSTTGFAVGQTLTCINWFSGTSPVCDFNAPITAIVPNTSITIGGSPPAAGTYQVLGYRDTFAGTDDLPSIQAAVNFAITNKYPTVRITNGVHFLSSTLKLGLGNSFYEIQIIGGGIRPATQGFAAGTTLLANDYTAPGMNFQGVRNGLCSGITLQGRNQIFIEFSQVFNDNVSSNVNDWLDPNLSPGSGPGGLQQHTPYAGITIDAYAGSAPSPQYAGITYGQNISSDVDVGGCEVDGFAIAFLSGVNSDDNGDFLKLNGFNGIANAYGITIGNNQSRVPTFTKSSLAWSHTLISNVNLGQGDGELAGTISDIATGEVYQLFNVSGSLSGPTNFTHIYCEACIRVGTFTGGAATSPFTLDSLYFNADDFATAVEPNCLVDGNADLKFIDPILLGLSRVVNLTCGAGNIIFERGRDYITEFVTPPSYVQTFINYTGGIFGGAAVANSQNVRRLSAPYALQGTFWYNSTSHATCPPASNCVWGVKYFADTLSFASPSNGQLNRTPIDQYARVYIDDQNQRWDIAPPNPSQIAIANTAIAGVAPSMSTDILSFGYCAAFQAGTNPLSILAPGDGLYQADTNTLFVVATVGSVTANANCTNIYPITAQQQNNMTINASNVWTKNLNPNPNFNSPNSTVFIIKQPPIAPRKLFYGTVASNCAFTTVTDGSVATDLTTYLLAGDPYYGLARSNPYRPWYVPATGMTLGTITNGSPGSIAAGTGTCTGTSNVPIFPYPIH